MSFFDGHRVVWQWQFLAQGEQTIPAVAATLAQYASADVLLAKAMDGTQFQGAFDYAPHSIKSLADWHAAVAEGATAGIQVFPWVVPHHVGDATAHAQLGETVIVDLEPYPPDFWSDGAAAVPHYLDGLRASGVQNIFVSVDPRPARLADLGFDAWARSVKGLLPQLYWTDFQQPMSACVPMLVNLMAYGVPVIPVLPYDGSATDVANFWTAAQQVGCRGVSLWRLGSANAAQLRAFGALDVTAPVDPRDQQIAQLTAERDRLQAVLDAVRRDVAA